MPSNSGTSSKTLSFIVISITLLVLLGVLRNFSEKLFLFLKIPYR